MSVLSFFPKPNPSMELQFLKDVCQAKVALVLNQESDGRLLAAKQPSIHLAHPHTPFYPLTRF